MPDVFDPYEERGVPNPHEFFEEEAETRFQTGAGSSNVPPLRIKRRQAKRIRPGFYEGEEPLADGLG